ncbi:MAG: hypothetical protein COA58_03370 [Bacteroidetes bacterium]|nr:MAG: hypothetical protein COA58_03370 [Bacteroidota bacterium]
MQLKLVEVISSSQIQNFHQFTRDLYADDPDYISHLDQDIESVFDSKKNTEFENGDAKRWLIYSDATVAGKIAAFYNRNTNQAGLGFFDCIDNQEVANELFSKGTEWLKSEGFDRVEAPVNFGERDKYWGLMVHGFTNPSYQENYNAPYYQSLFENYGFTKSIEQTTSEARPEDIDFEKYQRFTDRLLNNGRLTARHFRMNEMSKFVADFTTIYNQAWKQHEHFVPMTEQRVSRLFEEMKPIIREDLLWFLYEEEKPIAFYLSIIDVNQIFKYLNGSLNLWGKMKFLWYKKRVAIDKIRGIIFGVVPDYQSKGVYSILVMKMFEVMKSDPYLKSTELAWIGDFNPKMHALFQSLNAKKTKVHFTFEKLL